MLESSEPLSHLKKKIKKIREMKFDTETEKD
jgi:hypothetical protein